MGLALRDSCVNPKRSIQNSGFFPELACGFKMPLLLVEESIGPDRVCEVEKFRIQIASVDFQGLFVERLCFRGVSLLLMDVRDVTHGVSAGQEVILLTKEPGTFRVVLAGGGKIAILTGPISESDSLRRGTHDEGYTCRISLLQESGSAGKRISAAKAVLRHESLTARLKPCP